MRRGREFYLVEIEEGMGTSILNDLFKTEEEAKAFALREYAKLTYTVYQLRVTGKKTVVQQTE